MPKLQVNPGEETQQQETLLCGSFSGGELDGRCEKPGELPGPAKAGMRCGVCGQSEGRIFKGKRLLWLQPRK